MSDSRAARELAERRLQALIENANRAAMFNAELCGWRPAPERPKRRRMTDAQKLKYFCNHGRWPVPL
jgi:hypothetical protein